MFDAMILAALLILLFCDDDILAAFVLCDVMFRCILGCDEIICVGFPLDEF